MGHLETFTMIKKNPTKIWLNQVFSKNAVIKFIQRQKLKLVSVQVRDQLGVNLAYTV